MCHFLSAVRAGYYLLNGRYAVMLLCLRMTGTNTVSLACRRHSLVVKVKLKHSVTFMKRGKHHKHCQEIFREQLTLHSDCTKSLSNANLLLFVPQCFSALAFSEESTKANIYSSQITSLALGARTHCRPRTRSTTCPGRRTARTR